MLGADTNVIVRLLVGDDLAQQQARAEPESGTHKSCLVESHRK